MVCNTKYIINYYYIKTCKPKKKAYFYGIMKKRKRTSFELTEITGQILKELKLARWDYTEVLNAGIVAFSQLNDTQKQFFKDAAYGLKSEHSENAQKIFRDWILRVVEDAQGITSDKKRSRRAKPSKTG